MTIGRS
ncbi:hypothetical protein YPPY03_1442, partial [Yersinia pestis PY-03]